jgi:hypothetical protein
VVKAPLALAALALAALALPQASADAGVDVLSTRPGHGETAVDPSAPILVQWSEPMDRASAEAAFSLNPAASGSFAWAGDTMIFRSDGGFSPGIWYGASVTAGARSLEGDTLAAPVFFGFLTAPRAASSFPLTGVVASESGDPIPGITVEALHRGNGSREVVTFTDAAGGFAMIVEAGKEYRLRFAGDGWGTVEVDGVAGPGEHWVTLGVVRPAAAPFRIEPGLLVAGAALGGLAAAAFWLVDALRFAFFSASATMMMRFGREKVLDQFVRGQVFGAVVLSPGINYTEIRRKLRIANGQLAYHLHVLMKEEFVVSRRVGAHACFFPSGVPVDIGAGMRLSPLQERIVAELRATPGASQTDIAARLSRPVKTIHYNVTRLQVIGMIRVERAGKGSACFAVEPPPAQKRIDITAA